MPTNEEPPPLEVTETRMSPMKDSGIQDAIPDRWSFNDSDVTAKSEEGKVNDGDVTKPWSRKVRSAMRTRAEETISPAAINKLMTEPRSDRTRPTVHRPELGRASAAVFMTPSIRD